MDIVSFRVSFIRLAGCLRLCAGPGLRGAVGAAGGGQRPCAVLSSGRVRFPEGETDRGSNDKTMRTG